MGKIICLYGLPACGKTTQAEIMKDEFNFIHFGMGDRLREEVASGSSLGKEIKKFTDSGTLITDDLMFQVIQNVGEKIKEQGIIFDGFPRKISQAKMLEKIASELNEDVSKFFYLKVSPETALERISARAKLSQRSDDKDENAIKNRLGVFEKESKELIKYYQEKGVLVEIDGELPISEVYQKIKENLK